MICHRWASGRCANEGIPRLSDPFRKTQKSASGDALCTSAWFSGGAFPIPLPSGPWQAEHSRANSFAPACCARCCPSKGLSNVLARGGACWTSVPTRAQAAVATSQTRAPTTRTRNPFIAHLRYFENRLRGESELVEFIGHSEAQQKTGTGLSYSKGR